MVFRVRDWVNRYLSFYILFHAVLNISVKKKSSRIFFWPQIKTLFHKITAIDTLSAAAFF